MAGVGPLCELLVAHDTRRWEPTDRAAATARPPARQCEAHRHPVHSQGRMSRTTSYGLASTRAGGEEALRSPFVSAFVAAAGEEMSP